LVPGFRFPSLERLEPVADRRARGSQWLLSVILHVALIVATLAVPLYLYDSVPSPNERALRAVFVAAPQLEVAPPPPPPAPAAAGLRPRPAMAAASLPTAPVPFTAPLEVPDRVTPEPVDFGGSLGGVPGGVEGGVPGGVVGGVVGGLPVEVREAPPVAPVRIGGALSAPKLLHVVRPEYPEIARLAKLAGLVILEAQVGVDGRVEGVKVLRGIALLDEAAVEAVSQWRYRPLLLNGVPTPFILTVTVSFAITDS
jgi:protein TonB